MRVRRTLERGTSALELALVLPMFMLLVIGTVDFGRAVILYNTMSLAARDGARAAQVAVRPGDTNPQPEVSAAGNPAAKKVASALVNTETEFTTNTIPFKDANGYWYVVSTASTSYEPVAGSLLRTNGFQVRASSTLMVPCGKCE